MSEDTKAKFSIATTTIVNTLFGALICVLLWGFRIQLDNMVLGQKAAMVQAAKDADASFVSRDWFQKYIESNRQILDKMSIVQDRLASDISELKTDTAVIKAETTKSK